MPMDPSSMIMKRLLDCASSSSSYGDERPSFPVSFSASSPPAVFWKDYSSSSTRAILPPSPRTNFHSCFPTALVSFPKRRLPELPPLEYHQSPPKLKHPKLESPDDFESIFYSTGLANIPIPNFPVHLSESEGGASSIPLKPCSSACPFHRLPDLLEKHSSVEVSNYIAGAAALPQLVEPYNKEPPLSSKSLVPQKEKAVQRRKLIRDKFHSLERLIPYTRKLDTASMLEEAHKYIKFLEAQVSALKWMQHTAASYAGASAVEAEKVTAVPMVLERLNREQVLQLMVSSTAMQALLYENGWCVVSAEQAQVLKSAMQRMILRQQMMFSV